jgi:hypothetical protein
MNAPRVIKEEMSCCRSVVMFHPVLDLDERYPKTWQCKYENENSPCNLYLEKSRHSLQPSNHPKIKPILKRTQYNNSTRQKQPRVAPPRVAFVSVRSHFANSVVNNTRSIPTHVASLYN